MPRPPHDSLTFKTSTGKAHFTVNEVTAIEAPAGHLLLQTLRSHDQFNTTVYGNKDGNTGYVTYFNGSIADITITS